MQGCDDLNGRGNPPRKVTTHGPDWSGSTTAVRRHDTERCEGDPKNHEALEGSASLAAGFSECGRGQTACVVANIVRPEGDAFIEAATVPREQCSGRLIEADQVTGRVRWRARPKRKSAR